MSDSFHCPRGPGPGTPFKPPFDGSAEWISRDGGRVCSYCGSMNPDDLMARMEAGDVTLGPTDKDYKVYVEARPGAERTPIKFYFQHFSAEQQTKFIEMVNAKRLHIGFPGHFYSTPYFCQRVVGA